MCQMGGSFHSIVVPAEALSECRVRDQVCTGLFGFPVNLMSACICRTTDEDVESIFHAFKGAKHYRRCSGSRRGYWPVEPRPYKNCLAGLGILSFRDHQGWMLSSHPQALTGARNYHLVTPRTPSKPFLQASDWNNCYHKLVMALPN